MSKAINRRNFLKGSALAAGAMTWSTSLSAIDQFEKKTVLDRTNHMSASHFGAFTAHTKSGKFTSLTPLYKDASPMIQALPAKTYAQSRIEYPHVRKSFLDAKGPSSNGDRGDDEFVQVSWDVAIKLAAKEIKRVQEKHGYKSIYAGSYGWYSVGKLHNPQRLMNRLMKISGGYVGRIGDYSTAAAQVIMPHVMGSNEVYEQQTSWPLVLKHAKQIILWGADPMVTNQIGWEIPEYGSFEYFRRLKRLKDKGKINTISIDPIENDTQRYLGGEHIRPRPNTDVAMMIGMAHYLYTNKKYNENFIKKYTVGFNKFKDYFMGKDDKIVKDIKWASAICGVDEKTIKALADKLASKPTMIMGGWAAQRADHGEQFHWMVTVLSAMTGWIGQKGCGIGFSYHYCNGGTPTATSPGLPGISTALSTNKKGPWDKYVPHNIPATRIVDMIENGGKPYNFNGKKLTWPDIKMVYWAGGNPFHHHQDRAKMVKAWEKVDTVIVQDPFWTPTARMADIVFPSTTEIERNDIARVGDYSASAFIAMHKMVEPVGDSKNDYDICRLIAKELGYEDIFTEGKSEMQWIEGFYNAAKSQAAGIKVNVATDRGGSAAKAGDNRKMGKKMAMPAFKDFWKAGKIEFKADKKAMNFTRHEQFRKNPILNPLGTPSGKIHIYSRDIAGFKYDDCKGYPSWMEPAEWLGNKEQVKDTPLHLLSPHPKYRLHSQLNNTWLRDLYEIKGREPIWINPSDAKSRNLKTGDVVKVFNKRGSTLAGVLVTNAVSKGVVKLCEGSWYDPIDDAGSMCKHGDVNQLTMDKKTSDLAQGESANTALVEIKKYEDELPVITVFQKPNLDK